MNQLKREASKSLEESIERELKEERERRLQENPEKKIVVVREKFEEIDVDQQKGDDFDYENLIDVEKVEEEDSWSHIIHLKTINKQLSLGIALKKKVNWLPCEIFFNCEPLMFPFQKIFTLLIRTFSRPMLGYVKRKQIERPGSRFASFFVGLGRRAQILEHWVSHRVLRTAKHRQLV